MKSLSLNIGDTNIDVSGANVPTGGIPHVTAIIQALVIWAFGFAIIFCLLVLVYAGLMWLTASGDKQKLQNQRQRIAYALVGLVVVFLSYFIINLVGGFLNINLLAIPNP